MKKGDHVNQHRKLGPKQLPARFRRQRQGIDPETATEVRCEGDLGFDHYCDLDTFETPYGGWLGDEYLPEVYLDQAWERMVRRSDLWEALPEPGGQPAESRDPRHDTKPESPKVEPPEWCSTPEELIDFISKNLNCSIFDYFLNVSPPVFGECEEVRAFRDIARRQGASEHRPQQQGALLTLFTLSPFWIRSVRTWPLGKLTDDDWVHSLAAHLLVEFPVPAFLRTIWKTGGELKLPDRKAVAWYLLLGQGVSLSKAATVCDWQLPNRLVHWLYQAPQDLRLTEAVLWAEVMRLGGTPAEYRHLRQHGALAIDLTENSRNLAHFRQFLKHSIRWLASHRDELADPECQLILDWQIHLFTERFGRLYGNPNLQTLPAPWRFSVRRAIEEANAYARSRELPYRNCSWASHGWDWTETAADGTEWTVKELTTGKELFEEGRDMRHCVGSYASHCVVGFSAIFSMRAGGERHLTIEIRPDSKVVAQARGSSNRSPTPEEQRVLARWCRHMLQRR